MIVLDYRDKRPLYEQVQEKLTWLIVSGILQEDEKLPSVRNLALELSINPNTVQRAYRQLENDGFIYTIQGRGNFVAKNKLWKDDKQIEILKQFEKLILKAIRLDLKKEKLFQTIEEIYSDKERGN